VENNIDIFDNNDFEGNIKKIDIERYKYCTFV